MQYITVVCAVISLAAGGVIPENANAEIIGYENTNDGTGNYKFSYITSNGIQRDETGTLKNAGEPNEHIVVQGSYTYTDPDGKIVYVQYTADENGFHILDTQPMVPTTNMYHGIGFGLPSSAVASLLGK